MVVGIALQAGFARLDGIWRELPAEEPAALRLRQSALGKKEREAIFEAASAIRSIVDLNAEMSRLAELFRQFETKWRALIPK